MAEAQDLEWEEWDAQTSPLSFGHHCLAGSFAGVVRKIEFVRVGAGIHIMFGGADRPMFFYLV